MWYAWVPAYVCVCVCIVKEEIYLRSSIYVEPAENCVAKARVLILELLDVKN